MICGVYFLQAMMTLLEVEVGSWEALVRQPRGLRNKEIRSLLGS